MSPRPNLPPASRPALPAAPLAAGLAAILALALPSGATEEGLALVVTVPTSEVYLGEQVEVAITLSRAVSLSGTLEVERPRFPGFEVEHAEPGAEVTRDGRIERTDRYTLLPAAAGTFEIEIPGARLAAAGGREFTVAPERRIVVVRDVPDWVIDAIDVRDLRPPLSLPRKPAPGPWRALAWFAAILAAAWLVARRLARRAAPAPAGPPPPPPVDPWAEFEESMRRLDGSGLLQRGEFKAYVEALSMTLRLYLGRRFPTPVPAPEMTGEELAAFAASLGSAAEARLLRFIDETELVKFARMSADRALCEDLAGEAKALAGELERRQTPGARGGGSA